MFQGCLKSIQRMFQGCVNGVTRVYQDVSGCIRVCQGVSGCFKGFRGKKIFKLVLKNHINQFKIGKKVFFRELLQNTLKLFYMPGNMIEIELNPYISLKIVQTDS